jgi:hypothetical protein
LASIKAARLSIMEHRVEHVNCLAIAGFAALVAPTPEKSAVYRLTAFGPIRILLGAEGSGVSAELDH